MLDKHNKSIDITTKHQVLTCSRSTKIINKLNWIYERCAINTKLPKGQISDYNNNYISILDYTATNKQ